MTFQQLKNQTGLSRCYFNLGIIYLIKYDYILASEQFESAIQVYLEIIGIKEENLINQKIINSVNHEQENCLLALSKKITSKAYSLKQQAFSLIYQNYSHTISQKYEKINLISNTQKKSLKQTNEIQILLNQSLSKLKTVSNLVLNNSENYSVIFKVFLLQEIIEIMINLIDEKNIKIAVQLLAKAKNLQKKLNQNITSQIYDDSFDIKLQISQIQKSRQHFLYGLLEQKQNNFKQAAEQFILCLEEGEYYNNNLRKKVDIDQEVSDAIDLVILVQLEYQINYSTVEYCLKNIKQQNLIRNNDRLLILIFHTELDIFMPFTCINSENQWNQIFQSFQRAQQFIIKEQKYSKQPLHWKQALFKSFKYIYEYNQQDYQESDSIQWIEELQKQTIKNSAYSSQVLLEYSFNQLELHMVVVARLIKKYQNQQIIYNPKTIFTVCSYKEFTNNECPQFVYDQLNESLFYGDLYFVRSQFKFNLLTPQQQYFIKTNDFISFYGRAAFQATQTEGLIQIINIYNSDNTSAQTPLPSLFYNYTESNYETCKGTNFTEPYDPRCRDWFTYAQNHKGIFIYEPYTDALTGYVLMSLSTQMEYQSQFYSVDTIDFTMQNIVELFDSNLSKNQYSVLIHEFNSSVLYHPLLVFSQVTAWVDVEFFNINQFCSNTQDQMNLCLLNKQEFSEQVNKTIKFIQTGNYSIENKTSLSNLYQRWERFGQKQISIVLPVQSKLKGFNNQQPYSFAIILVARVLTDNKESSKYCYYSEFEDFLQDKTILNNPQSFIQQDNEQLKSSNIVVLNKSKDNFNQRKVIYQKPFEQMINSQINQCNDLNKSKCQVLQQSSFQNFVTFNQINTSLKQSNHTLSSTKSQNFQEYKNLQNQKKVNGNEKILQGLKPLFLEMKIIKKVFQDLEMLINYKIDVQNQNSQDQMNTLFHFAKAKVTFQQLKNQTGLSRCYFNLGIIYLIKYDYVLASEYFESAFQVYLEMIGINIENLINQKVINSVIDQQKNHLLILSKQNVSKAYCLKQQAFSMIYSNYNSINNEKLEQTNEIQILLRQSLSNLKTVYNLVLNNQENYSLIFKVFILQEIIEIMIHLKEEKKINKDLKIIDELLDTTKNLQKKLNQQRISQIQENSFDIKLQISEIQKSKQHFLFGLLEQKQNNFQQSAEQFIMCLEEGVYYNSNLRKKAIHHLNCLFRQIPLYQMIDISQELNDALDLVILIQLEYQINYTSVEYCLKNIKKQHLIRNNDRLLILVFHTELDIFMPFTTINSESQWNQIFHSFQRVQQFIIQEKKYSKQLLHWKQALFNSFKYIYEYNQQDYQEYDSIQWIYELQKQTLRNSAYSSQVLLEHSFNQLELHMILISGLIKKYQNQQIIYHPKTIFTVCSYKEFTYNQCPEFVYDQLNESLFYGDLYFVRSYFKFNLLTPQQKYFIKTNDYISFYGRAAFQAMQTKGLIQISSIYNSDNSSVQTVLPSVFFNFTESIYETCKGTNFTEPYDPRCRDWFLYSQNHKGIFIYKPYTDALTENILLSLSIQMEYESQFYSVNTIDFIMQNIPELFGSNLNQNLYSVLFHEFNSTVIYHPLFVFQQVTALEDVEFFNINQFCSNTQDQMDICLQQKQQFSEQLNQTIQFIKIGNYSIENKNSLSQLYQKWERFGQTQISIILPVQSKLKGFNNQQPYSFSIMLVGKVLTDNRVMKSNSQIQENMINLYQAKRNQYFQVKTIKNKTQFEVELSRQCQYSEFEEFLEDKKMSNKTQKQIYKENQQLKSPKSFVFSLQKDNLNLKKNNFLSENEKSMNKKSEYLINSQINQYYGLNKSKSQAFQQNNIENFVTFNQINTSIRHSNFSKLCLQSQSIYENKNLQSQKEVFHKQKILQGLKPLFLEMKIIKRVFQDLEMLINYKIDAQNQNLQDQMNNIFHFAKAKVTFQKLKNQTGLTSEQFESAIQVYLETIGINEENLINQKIINLVNHQSENYLLALSKKIVSSAYCLKQQAFSLIYLNYNSTNSQKQEYLYLQIFKQIKDFFVLQEIIEIMINLKQNKKLNNDLKIIVSLFDTVKKLQKQTNEYISSQVHDEKLQIKLQILEIQKSRQHFLYGILEQKQNNLKQAAEQFILCLEVVMKYLILRLLVTVSLPTLIGVAFVLSIFYNILWNSLDQWQNESGQWNDQMQKQMLMNSAYSQQLLLEYSFNQLELHMVVIKGLIKKYQNSKIVYNTKSVFTVCSYREFTFNQCPQYVYDQLNESIFYADLYFVRDVFKFDLLTPEQQQFIKINDFISYYGRSAFKSSQFEGLIQIINIYNSDNTSVQQVLPSMFFNYTDSDYEYCYGNKFIEPYDPRCRDWFIYAQKNQGLFIYEPYIDYVTGALLMSLSTQIDYDSQFYSVDTIDFTMQNINEIFDSNLSQNAYSVLFHEFNQTVLYHPLLVFYSVMSWSDVEYFNINQFCNNSKEQMDLCLSQKQQFSSQVNQTIKFIQSGDYLIETENNLNQLYQKWERFGQKQQSIILPVMSRLKGYNNQKPYSFSIILIARVITDNSDNLKLSNLINFSLIKTFLLIEFALVSTAILIFIINYGMFQVYSIKQPIEILILFLQESYQQQLSSHTKQNPLNQSKEETKYLTQKIKLIKTSIKIDQFKQNYEKKYLFKSQNQNYSQYQVSFQNYSNQKHLIDEESSKQCSNNDSQDILNQQNSSNNIQQIFKYDNQQSRSPKVLINKIRQSSKSIFSPNAASEKKIFNLNSEKMLNYEQNHSQNQLRIKKLSFQQKQIDSNISNIKRQKKTSIDAQLYKKTDTELTKSIIKEDKIQDKDKILKGLKPLFLEMKIIKKVFQNLELLINYQVDAQNQNQQDFINNLFHFSKAKSTFQKLQNQTGLSRCYFNLGIIYLIKNEYKLASEHFESSIQVNFNNIGINYQDFISQKVINPSIILADEQLLIQSKKILCHAFCMKEQAFFLTHIYQQNQPKATNQICQDDNSEKTIQNYANESKTLLIKSLNIFQIIYNLGFGSGQIFSDILKIFILQEIIEIMIKLNAYKQINRYFDALDQLLNNENQQNLSFTHQSSQSYRMCISSKGLIKRLTIADETNDEVRKQIIQIQKSRYHFLLGLIEQNGNNLKQAIEQFTLSLEEGAHYSPILRQKTILHINQLFQQSPQYKNIDLQQHLQEELNDSIDFIILIQLQYQMQYSSIEFCIQNLQQSKFFEKNDRILILIFHQELDVLMQFTEITNEKHWNLIINTIQNLEKYIVQKEKIPKQQLSWQEALYQSLNYIYELKMEYDSGIWINSLQKQILQNSAFSHQVLLEYSFNQLELHMVVIKSLIKKYQNSEIKYNPKTIFTVCSYREFTFNECPDYVYDQLNKSIFYADLYFVRTVFKFDFLTPSQQYFIKTVKIISLFQVFQQYLLFYQNDFVSFYSRAAFKASQNEGIIQISNIYNSDQTSVQQVSPSVFYNYTASDFEDCFGNDFIEPYDARCRYWYKYAQKNKGFFIFEPYIDALTGTLLMSLSTQMEYESQFYSVDNIDFQMNNILQIFDSVKGENSYSVLFHEFNSTVLYHPLLVFYQKMTWVDVEFLNINQFCGYNLEQLELCNNQKEQLSSQVNETIQFIKTGNYSIENQINLGQLYQYWERFGQKQVSIVFPIQSNLKGLNNQFPYSYSIIMIARVITDQNENSADQSQHINFSNQQSKFYKQSNDQYKSQNNSLQVKQINHKTDSQTQKDVSQISTKKIPQSSEKIYESSQQSNLIQKNSQSFEQSYSVNKNNCSLNTSNFKDKTQRSKNSELEDELYQKKFENKNTFLQELKPLFLEMKIIKDVFKDLESLINYSIEAQNQNSENSTKTFFHFCKAKCTFQQLKNQIGLGRCYYNLGIVSLLNYDYNLAKEYFETAIFLSFESLGTNYNNIINQKIIKQCQNNTENQILIVSKRIFSKAYCLKQQALQKYYIYENIDFENQENIQHSKIKRRHLLQIKQQIYSSEQIQLLKQSLETFQIVLSFVQNNNYNFSEIFQIFLYQEIIEILIFLNFNNNNSHKISRYIKTVNQIIINSKYQYAYISEAWQKASLEQKKYYKQSIMSENNFDINKQIMQIQKSKQLFLLALNEQFKNNYFGAIELFIQSLEEGTHYSPSLRKKITCHLSQLINLISDIPFKQMLDCDDESFLFKKQNSHIDLIVILQLDYYKQHSTVEICLKAIQQSNLLNSSDRIQILIYDSNITTLMPFTNIHNINHWNLIINSFKDLEQLIQKDEVNKKQQLTWQEALFQSINFIYDVNQSDLVSLKQNFYYDQTNQKNDLENSNSNPNNEQVFKNILLNNPNKVILLFSKDQETDQTIQFAQNYQTKLKLIKFKKPIIYHLKEYPLIQSIIPNFNFPDMIYEYFYDENILIANLTKLKNEEILNDEYEFLSILNNS
ncbi:hypothetical protein ABPG73_008029 [Tetrahymena malaccensis]